MRLISAHIRGYGRLLDTKVNLDSKVIAVVGPNEAGKTTLLNALEFIDRGDELPRMQRSRGGGLVGDDTAITTVVYELDDDERAGLEDLGIHEPPRRAEISRLASGKLATVRFTPNLVKSVEPLAKALSALESAPPHLVQKSFGNSSDLRKRMHLLINSLERAVKVVGSPLSTKAIAAVDQLLEELGDEPEGDEDLVVFFRALNSVRAWVTSDPLPAASDLIWTRSPTFVLFDEPHRQIQSFYTLDRTLATDPPPAFANLARMAGLNLRGLIDAVEAGDVSRRETLIARANRRLNETFARAWKRSQLLVQLGVDGGVLRVRLIDDGDNVSEFGERSAGMRMFVALVAFLTTHDYEHPPILLIDEAESHLHIDAQADLVNMFVAQEHALKVIYTTHSPACLPPDLGTGIRCVVPRRDEPLVSDALNSFWQGSTGFSPLMLAMGASAAAFTPARYAVLAEGPTEMILLPSLIRAAIGATQLPYQVAGGLSEAPKALMSDLDLEAARVAYLVDSDGGGAAIRKSLVGSGVPEGLIVESGSSRLEDMIDPLAYGAAVAALLPECNRAVANDVSAAITAGPEGSDAASLQRLVEEKGLKFPSKKALADWLVQNGEAKPSSTASVLLTELHLRLLAALNIPADVL